MQANLLAPIGESAAVGYGPAVSSKMIPSLLPRDNFWEVGAYRRVVKRVDDGAALVDEFRSMVQERAAIEKKTASMLTEWSKKWENKISKGPEFQEYSIYTAWEGLITEANATAALHSQSDSKLDDLANRHMGAWKKANYPKTGMKKNRYKATKLSEEGFEKAQKNWARLYAKFSKTKKTWKQNTKLVAAVNKKLDNPKNSMSTEDWNKLKEKQKKVDRAEERNKFKCEQRLKDLKEDESRYRNEMKEQFLSCQDVEQKRVEFLKHAMGLMMHSLPTRADAVIESVLGQIDEVNADADLVSYAEIKGDGMPLMLPTMELDDAAEFDRRMSMSIAVATTPKSTPGGNRRSSMSVPVLIDAEIDEDSNSDDDWDSMAPPPSLPGDIVPNIDSLQIPGAIAEEITSEEATSTEYTEVNSTSNASTTEEVVEPELATAQYVALYDYTAAEDEELSFSTGDCITELEGEDDQGWCKGMDKGGKVGFYPAHYVQKSGESSM